MCSEITFCKRKVKISACYNIGRMKTNTRLLDKSQARSFRLFSKVSLVLESFGAESHGILSWGWRKTRKSLQSRTQGPRYPFLAVGKNEWRKTGLLYELHMLRVQRLCFRLYVLLGKANKTANLTDLWRFARFCKIGSKDWETLLSYFRSRQYRALLSCAVS